MAAEVAPICCFQRIVLYETKARFYLVGSNNAETRFRVLKIDRTEPKDLVLSDDKVEYNRRQIKQLLTTINAGNVIRTSKPYETSNKGLHRSISAYGILGFVRFLEGYYIILITERRKQAQIGGHTIYKIEDTRLVSIPNEAVIQKYQHPDESRYLRIFQNVDLSSNFYYSYSYDLTQTLQHNIAPLIRPTSGSNAGKGSQEELGICTCNHSNQEQHSTNGVLIDNGQDMTCEKDSKLKKTPEKDFEQKMDKNEEKNEKDSGVKDDMPSPENKRDVSEENRSDSQRILNENQTPAEDRSLDVCPKCKKLRTRTRCGNVPTNSSRKISKAYYKFVWNKHLLSEFEGKVHQDWVLHAINGFIGQSNICVYGKPIYVTLIARRSAEFAGTRFLKRGANDEGYVANEVETEQIVHDASVLSFKSGHFTSYAQLRGSVPTFWSQDMKQVMVPKPQINVDRSDPFCVAASKHVNQLFERFGAPLVILNLVKKRERKRHEQILSEQLQSVVDYLNQFLPVEFHIKYIAWDMARFNKSKDLAVIEKLTVIANQVFKTTGFFHSHPELYCNQVRKDPRCDMMGGLSYSDLRPGRGQNGVLRVNCVDCLDRTNTAQFMVGKCALGFQLHALGVIETPSVEFDSDAVRILEDLYEAHGDTLALQYGGSQLVHGIRTYRKVSPFTSHSHDIMQTISRYYSNAFNDADKQQAMNVFLGVFVPIEGMCNIWDMTTDYYLHHTSTCNLKAVKKRKSYSSWLDEMVINSLPHPVWEGLCLGGVNLASKDKESLFVTYPDSISHEEMDVFSEYYRPHELSMFDTIYPLTMQRSCKDFMPPTCTDHSPFIVRDRFRTPVKKRTPVRKAVAAAPGLPAEESSDDDGSSDDDSLDSLSPTKDLNSDVIFASFKVIHFFFSSDKCTICQKFVCLSRIKIRKSILTRGMDLMPSMKDVYGVGLTSPDRSSYRMYERFAEIAKTAESNHESPVKPINYTLKTHYPFSHDSVRQVKLPSVDKASKMFYVGYTQTTRHGNIGMPLNDHSIYMYRKYTHYPFISRY